MIRNMFWGVVMNVTVFNLRVAGRTLREIEYRHDRLKRTLSPIR